MKNGVKIIQAAAYNGAHTVFKAVYLDIFNVRGRVAELIHKTNIVQEFTLCYYPQNQNDFWQQVGLLSTLTDPAENFEIKWGKVHVVGIIYSPD